MYVQSSNVFCLRTLKMADNSLVKTELFLVKREPINAAFEDLWQQSSEQDPLLVTGKEGSLLDLDFRGHCMLQLLSYFYKCKDLKAPNALRAKLKDIQKCLLYDEPHLQAFVYRCQGRSRRSP